MHMHAAGRLFELIKKKWIQAFELNALDPNLAGNNAQRRTQIYRKDRGIWNFTTAFNFFYFFKFISQMNAPLKTSHTRIRRNKMADAMR